MSMKCDRCGEVFNPEPPDEMGRHKPNAVILVDKNVHDAWDYWSCDCYDEPFLCPSCMAKLNNWLKENRNDKQNGFATMKATQSSVTSVEQNTNSRRMNVYRILIIALTAAQRWKG